MSILTWRVSGMKCASCERLIEQELLALPNAEEAEVSLSQHRAAVRFADGSEIPRLKHLYRTLESHGYFLSPESSDIEAPETNCAVPLEKPPFKARAGKALLALAAVGLLAHVVWKPIAASLPTLNSGTSFGAMVLFGVLASISTCLAATGGFLLAYTSRASSSKTSTLYVHIGRVTAFVIGGGLLGALGSTLPSISGSFSGLFALLLGIGFLLVGLNLLDMTPSLATFGLRMPRAVSRLTDKIAASKSPFAAFGVGAATFFLPCGFTQTAQALALASGSAQSGMFMLGAFALGTLPVLSGVTAFGKAAGVAKQQAFKLAAGAMLFFFAFGQIDGGLTLLGSPVTTTTLLTQALPRQTEIAAPAYAANEQVIRMTVAYGTYQPNNLTIRAGIPVRWEIDGQDIYGCASDITIPSLRVYSRLQKGLNVISFTAPRAGVIPFSCGMGMIRGTFTVIN